MNFNQFVKDLKSNINNVNLYNPMYCEVDDNLYNCYDIIIDYSTKTVLIFIDENYDKYVITPNLIFHKYHKNKYANDFQVMIVSDSWWESKFKIKFDYYNLIIKL